MAQSNDLRGRWALVTGASAGIGTAVARELAARGVNLILTARRRERLEALAVEFRGKGIDTRIVTADLNDPAAPQQIYDATEGAGLAVDILINNAGFGQYGAFEAGRIDPELGMVRVNCEAVVHIARLFVPRMIERRRGWMLVVASTASFQPIPYYTTYAATKVFDRFFALGLAAEVERYNVKVTALCPGPTETEFFDISGSPGVFRRFGVQAVDEVAREGVDGLVRGKRTMVPNRKGVFTAFLVRFIPTGMITRILEKGLRPKGAEQS